MADRAKIMSMLGKDSASEEEYFAEFMPPPSYTPPDEASDGRVFEEMFSLKQKPDGTLCVVKVAGIGKEGESMEEEMVEETTEY